MRLCSGGTEPSHIGDERLELNALDRPAESYVASVEEHLLVCEECRVRLAGWNGYIRAMREVSRSPSKILGADVALHDA